MVEPRRPKGDDIAARVADAMDYAAREIDRSVMLHALSHALRETDGHLTSCAWCHRYEVDGVWYAEDASPLLSTLVEQRPLTHGICPSCFGELVPPGQSYPDAW